jgi:hypothetical protein
MKVLDGPRGTSDPNSVLPAVTARARRHRNVSVHARDGAGSRYPIVMRRFWVVGVLVVFVGCGGGTGTSGSGGSTGGNAGVAGGGRGGTAGTAAGGSGGTAGAAAGGSAGAAGGAMGGRGGVPGGAGGGRGGAAGGNAGAPGGSAGGGHAGQGGQAGSSAGGGSGAVDAGADHSPSGGTGGQSASDGGASPLWDGTPPVRLSTAQASWLFVSKDERHVGYTVSAPSSCSDEPEIGDLEVLATDPTPSTAVIDTFAGVLNSFFTDDSKWLVFPEYTRGTNPCASIVTLRYASSTPPASGAGGAGGTTSNALDSFEYYYQYVSVVGDTVEWRGFTTSASDTGTPHVQKIGGLGSAFSTSSLMPLLDPTGNLMLVSVGGQTRIATVGNAVKFVLNDGSLGTGVSFAWSPDGQRLAYAYQASSTAPITLEVMNNDGTNPQVVSTNCRCQRLVFSPDSTRLAYDILETDGTISYVVQPVAASGAGGPGFSLHGAAFTGDRPSFSPDGRWLQVSTGDRTLYEAPVAASGSFVLLSTPGAQANQARLISTADYSFIAFVETDPGSGATALVVTSPDGARRTRPFTTGVVNAWYEQTTSAPKLAVETSVSVGGATTATMYFLPADGTGTPKTLAAEPAPFSPAAFWLGRVFVYTSNEVINTATTTGTVDLAAINDDGSHEGTLDTKTLLNPKAGVSVPTRLFYARAPAAGGGIYMFAPPVP